MGLMVRVSRERAAVRTGQWNGISLKSSDEEAAPDASFEFSFVRPFRMELWYTGALISLMLAEYVDVVDVWSGHFLLRWGAVWMSPREASLCKLSPLKLDDDMAHPYPQAFSTPMHKKMSNVALYLCVWCWSLHGNPPVPPVLHLKIEFARYLLSLELKLWSSGMDANWVSSAFANGEVIHPKGCRIWRFLSPHLEISADAEVPKFRSRQHPSLPLMSTLWNVPTSCCHSAEKGHGDACIEF